MNDANNALNKVRVDEFGRVNALLALNKRTGITSHDLVDEVRKKLNTRKVGHAGALDPFATGVMLVLVGKFTKMSDELMASEKDYKARILFGISTSTQDPEGEIKENKNVQIDEKKLRKVLEEFEGGYEQYVPVFSSVKVEGNKLRKLARKSRNFRVEEGEARKVVFDMPEGEMAVELPKKNVVMEDIKILDFGKLDISKYELAEKLKGEYAYCDIEMTVSKGTYIRQFAEDLGEKLGVPAMLLELERTKVGDVRLEDTIAVEDLALDELQNK